MTTEKQLYEWADACLMPSFHGAMVPAWLRRGVADGLGAVALFHGNMRDRDQVRRATAALRAASPSVLIALDEEGGDVTRLELGSGSSYPGNLALGTVDAPDVTWATAVAIGRDLADVGITLNFAPVADVNSNPANPVIGVRAFGSDPDLVARHTAAYVHGLQSAGVAACAKHFPGHGNTTVDSHFGLPEVHDTAEKFERIAFPPFAAAIEAGVMAVMVAHLVAPYFDSIPATISPCIITDLLRRRLGYDGLVITDSLQMHPIRTTYGIPEAGVRAIVAGVDLLCLGPFHGQELTAATREALVAGVIDGRLTQERLAEAAGRVRRVAAWSQAATTLDARVTADISTVGIKSARRAVTVRGSVVLHGDPVVIELGCEPNPVVGAAAWGIGTELARRFPDAVVHRHRRVRSFDVPAVLAVVPPDRALVLVVRDAHQHAWMAEVIDAVLAARPDTVLVEMGLPHLSHPAARRYLATHGAARVCAQAAVELMAGV